MGSYRKEHFYLILECDNVVLVSEVQKVIQLYIYMYLGMCAQSGSRV